MTFLSLCEQKICLETSERGGGEHGRVVILGAKPNHEPKKTNKQIKKMKP